MLETATKKEDCGGEADAVTQKVITKNKRSILWLMIWLGTKFMLAMRHF